MKKTDPFLLPPTQDIQTNLGREVDEEIADSDDIPSGWNWTLTGKLTPRPDDLTADAHALRQQQEGKQKKRKK